MDSLSCTSLTAIVVFASACSSPHVAPRSAAAPAATDETAIAAVEHGLIPERRVAGENGGSSIDERLRAYHVPAVSIAVIHDHRLAWARAYGVKDLRTGERADSDTLFQAASISKLVTAVAALREVDAGKVALDADINLALRGWKLPASDFTRGHPVTLAQLLLHTGGVNLHSVVGHAPDAPLPTLPQILDGKPPANTEAVRVEHVPGEKFRYSGGGSLIVQQLIVDLTRQPFADALDQLVLGPLHLAHSSFAVPLPRDWLPRRATPHDWDQSVLPDLVYPEAAPAGLWTTPSDLARLLAEIQLGLEGRSQLVSTRMARAMTTAVAPIGVPDVATGIGTFVERHGSGVYFGHDGHNDGFLAMSRATTSGGEGAVVMSNGAGGARVIMEVMRSIAAAYRWPGWLKPPIAPVKLDAARLAQLAGHFAGDVDSPLTLVVRGDRLEAREPFEEPRELIPVGDDAFMSRDDTRFQLRGDQLVETPSDPEDAPLVRKRAARDDDPLTLLAAGHDAEALARYRALIASHPTDPALAEARFDALATDLLDRRYAVAEALRVYKIEAALYPDSAYANAGVALAYLRSGHKSEAAPLYARARTLAAAKKLPEIPGIYLGIRMDRVKRLSGD